MFGSTPPTTGKLYIWLEHLRGAESATKIGQLVQKNLLEDWNVPASYYTEVYNYVESQVEVTSSDEASRLYQAILDHLKNHGMSFSDPHNQQNCLPAIPFPKLGRVIALPLFMRYNVLGPSKTPKKNLTGPLRAKIALSELRKKIGNDPTKLQSNIGSDPTWACDAATFGPRPETVDPGEIRDCLGLDDSQRFAAGEYLVLTIYDSANIPGGECFRPTVLDAGWWPVSAAFLPNTLDPVSPASAGKTQHLKTGQPSADEVLHRPFPANLVESFHAIGPLRTDPPSDYKQVRLGA